jgi:hypothetical protein
VNLAAFDRLLRKALPENTVLRNPVNGNESTLVNCDEVKIRYLRRKRSFYVRTRDLYEAYEKFIGGDVTNNDLKRFRPEVFDSRNGGHDCHCTFFLLALQKMRIAGELWGAGKRGSPFGITLPPRQAQ